ncbi:MAG: ABC transporter permease [Spirobacillus cienkowskii]|jgi:ABC-type dipeptide/oligopeptide/nickel transport system permease component|uniref:ABC transporter permease n=1 Tax=Spirobacillus cienkowskii TaxID=495820 RepID=A0A369KXA9_9BACT|nr:MAG: ABC transporter permease [Spirobacillus cienkowskii]
MLKVFFQRFFQLLAVLWGVSSIVFFLQRMIPGNPADTILGVDASDADKLEWLAKYGLNDPLWNQYLNFLKNLIHGDLGFSYSSFIPVTELILPRLWETVQLATVAFIFSILIATFIGIISASQAGKFLDKAAAIVSLLAISAPSFIIGPVLMWIFAVKLDYFPLMGNEGPSSFILPAITLGASLAAFSSRMIRSGIVDVLQEDYIRTAKSKGLSQFIILTKHALRNAFLPTLTVLGMQLGVLLSGAVITEQIFNWPGLGSLIVEAVQQREYNIVSGCVIIMATIYVVCNLLVDILYRIFDPRVRLT